MLILATASLRIPSKLWILDSNWALLVVTVLLTFCNASVLLSTFVSISSKLSSIELTASFSVTKSSWISLIPWTVQQKIRNYFPIQNFINLSHGYILVVLFKVSILLIEFWWLILAAFKESFKVLMSSTDLLRIPSRLFSFDSNSTFLMWRSAFSDSRLSVLIYRKEWCFDD